MYANEADLLNVALYGKTVSDWRAENPGREGNIRDYSTIEQVLVMANLESLNAEYIRNGIDQGEWLRLLNQAAIYQLKALSNLPQIKNLNE